MRKALILSAVIILILIQATLHVNADGNTTSTIWPTNPSNTTTTSTYMSNNTTSTTHRKTTTPAGGNDVIGMIGNVLKPRKGTSMGITLFIFAVMVTIAVYLWYSIPSIIGKKKASPRKSYARQVKVSPPSGYDFLAFVVDDKSKTISREEFVKIGEGLYISTNVGNPSFLYVPDTAETYICTSRNKAVPCGLAYRKGILSLLIDPELASTHELAASSKLIGITGDELDKLLGELYKKGERKLHEVPISPDTRIGFVFNIKNMLKYYNSILRNADEMMIHFLHTANQAESIERFMKTSIKMQEAKFGWMKWFGYVAISIGLAVAIIAMFT